MTVDAIVPVVVFPFTGPGSYPFTYQVYEDTDVKVTHYDAITGLPQVLVLNTDYTVTLVDGVTGGTVVVTWSDATDGSLEVLRVLPYEQETSWPTNSPFSPRLLERDLDKEVMLIQQNKEAIDRSIKAVPGSSGDYTLPQPLANAVIGIWDPTGQFLLIGPTADQVANAQGYANAAAQSAVEAEEAFETERTWIAIQNYQRKVLPIVAGEVDWHLNDAPFAHVNLTESIDLNAPTYTLTTEWTIADSMFISIRFADTGGNVITWDSVYEFGAVGPQQPVPNAVTVFVFESDGLVYRFMSSNITV